MESDGSSNALSGASVASDADSTAPACEERNLKSCASGISIVTYDEAAKIGEEEECGRAGKRKLARRLKGSQLSPPDEQETSINTGLRLTGSAGPAWTDDKHCSYLNSIEATFVQSLYGQDYHAVDVSGQDDQDCVESRPVYSSYSCYSAGCGLFTSLQRGCYGQREYYRPHVLNTFAPSNSALLLSPWIQHFNPKTSIPNTGAGGSGHGASIGFGEGFFNDSVREEVIESFPHLPDATEGPLPWSTHQGPQSWSTRFQSQHFVSPSAPNRVDSVTRAKKRTCSLDHCGDVILRPKKHRSMQRSLAEIDLEMEEQFVLKQRNLKERTLCLDLKDDGGRLREVDAGDQVNNKEEDEDLTVTEGRQPFSAQPSPDWFISRKDTVKSRFNIPRRIYSMQHSASDTVRILPE